VAHSGGISAIPVDRVIAALEELINERFAVVAPPVLPPAENNR
jgi:hypothetical protein